MKKDYFETRFATTTPKSDKGHFSPKNLSQNSMDTPYFCLILAFYIILLNNKKARKYL